MTPPGSIVPRGRRRCGLSTCRQEIPSSHLFCLPHWRQVPAEIQDRIKRYWRPGLALSDQFPEYVVAVRHTLEVLRPRPTPAPKAAPGQVDYLDQAGRKVVHPEPDAAAQLETQIARAGAAGCVPFDVQTSSGHVRGIVCLGRRGRRKRTCSWCNRPASAERECDYLAPGADKTCDKPLCRSCAVPAGTLPGGDRADHCPGHPKPLPGLSA